MSFFFFFELVLQYKRLSFFLPMLELKIGIIFLAKFGEVIDSFPYVYSKAEMRILLSLKYIYNSE